MSIISKTLVIVGGGGIAMATAKLAALSGYRVVLGYHEQILPAEAIVQEINSIKVGSACAFQLDATNSSSVKFFFENVIATYGIPDAVAHCVGMSVPRAALIDIDPDSISKLLATNLSSAFFCVQAAAKIMAISRGGRGGSIVTLSSEAARFGGNLISPYAASKAGINTMTVGVARELAPEGIRLNSVSPGVIDTDSHANTHKFQRTAMLASIPMGRMGLPDEVAKAVLWLLSDDASYISGTIMTIAGGR